MRSSPSKKIVLVASSLIVLAVVLLVFTNPWSTMRSNSRQVALKSPDEVDRIVLSDFLDSTVLTRENDVWILNGKEEAGKVPVENLLIAAGRLELTSIVSAKEEPENRVSRVIRYYKGNKLLLAYELLTKEGRYLVTPGGSGNSFFVSVSGYPGLNLDRVFSAASNHYREHLLIELAPSEISRIAIQLQDGTSFSFEQDQEGNISSELKDLNEQAVRLLFSYFTSIVYEDKTDISSSSLQDEDSSPASMALLNVESHSGEKHSLEVFPYVENPGEQAHMFKALVLHNNGSEALIVNYIYLDVLMRNLSHYVGDK